MGAPLDGAGDLVEVELHRLRVGKGERQGGAGAASRADGAEQRGALVALVGGLRWARSPSGPLPDAPVLLADAALRAVLEPDLNRLAPREIGEMGLQRRRNVFLNASIVCPS